MIDTHCHLNDNRYNKDLDTVVNNALKNGVEYIIVPATNPNDLDKTIKIAERFDNVYCGLGVHPHDASKFNEKVYEKMLYLSNHKKVIAIGEFGLDYFRNLSSKEEQRFAFNRQLDLAIATSLPAILHNRDADNDFVEILEKYMNKGLHGVCHCYSSGLEVAEKLLKMGVYFSFTANITFPKVDMSDVIKLIPLEKIMLETDSPYMTPPPNRSERNVPQNVLKVAEKISNIKNISLKEVIRMTTDNAKRFFRIPTLAVLFILLNVNLYSQSNINDDYYYEDEYEYEEFPDPYFRKLGFGPLLGSNTFVDRYSFGRVSFSYEGLFSAGAMINYRFMENFIAQVAYQYSENSKLVERLPDSVKGWIDPNYHNAIEFSIIGMVVPRNMVNFYVSLGTTYFMNKISKNFGEDGIKSKHYFEDNNFGLNTGVGIFINFSLGKMGTIVVNGEWKLGFRLDKITLDYDPREFPIINGEINPKYRIDTDYSTMSSIPRGGIIWYIPFF